MTAVVDPNASVHRWLSMASVIHAGIVFGIWLMAENQCVAMPVPPKFWAVIFWLWFLWPLVLSLHPGRSLSRVFGPTIIGFVFLIPCLTTLVAFTAWGIHGFAP